MGRGTERAGEKTIDPLRFRRALGTFVTGVTVITTLEADGTPRGFTANSFTSVSLDPPLILVCIAKTSSSCAVFSQSAHFAVNILSDDQRTVSATFASRNADRFSKADWSPAASGVPLISGSVSWFDCARHDLIEAGDHVILIGRVTAFADSAACPLAYARGDFLDLDMDQKAAEAATAKGGIAVGALLDRAGQILLQRQGETWTLPMAAPKERFGTARAAFDRQLCASGIEAKLTFLYSVYDAPSGEGAQFVFRGMLGPCALPADMTLFPMDRLPLDQVSIRQHRSVLLRYRREHQAARFGLYVAAPDNVGQVAMIDGEPAPWEMQETAEEPPT